MSRIGKQPVIAPAGVTITVGKDNVVTVKGPKGELKQEIDRDITDYHWILQWRNCLSKFQFFQP